MRTKNSIFSVFTLFFSRFVGEENAQKSGFGRSDFFYSQKPTIPDRIIKKQIRETFAELNKKRWQKIHSDFQERKAHNKAFSKEQKEANRLISKQK